MPRTTPTAQVKATPRRIVRQGPSAQPRMIALATKQGRLAVGTSLTTSGEERSPAPTGVVVVAPTPTVGLRALTRFPVGNVGGDAFTFGRRPPAVEGIVVVVLLDDPGTIIGQVGNGRSTAKADTGCIDGAAGQDFEGIFDFEGDDASGLAIPGLSEQGRRNSCRGVAGDAHQLDAAVNIVIVEQGVFEKDFLSCDGGDGPFFVKPGTAQIGDGPKIGIVTTGDLGPLHLNEQDAIAGLEARDLIEAEAVETGIDIEDGGVLVDDTEEVGLGGTKVGKKQTQ